MFFRRSSKQREQLSDEELIRRYKETADSSFVGELYERYALQIYGICRKYMKDDEESRDTSMEVFEYLLAELRKYEIQNFKSWLCRATQNFCLMRLRKYSSQSKRAEEYKKNEQAIMEPQEYLHPSEARDKEEEIRRLQEALGTLKVEQKTCVELFFLNQKSYEEVASLTGFSYKEVKSYIQNGKRNLKNYLSSSNG